MATAPGKLNKNTAKGKNGKVVVAEPAKTTEADGYSQDTKTQKTAKGDGGRTPSARPKRRP